MKQILNYNIPTTWEEVTVKQQLDVERLSKENPDFNSLAVLSGYCNIPLDELKRMHISEVKKLLEALTFVSTPLPTEPISEFDYKGETYSVIPTLLKSETQDFLSLTSVEGKPDALLYVIAVLSKKKTGEGFNYESLSDFDLEQRAKHFQDLPLTIASRINVFFCLISGLSQIDYKEILKEADQNLNESINYLLTIPNKRNGGGLFILCVKMMLRAYLKSLRSSWSKYYSSFNSVQQKQSWITKFRKLFRKKQKRS